MADGFERFCIGEDAMRGLLKIVSLKKELMGKALIEENFEK